VSEDPDARFAIVPERCGACRAQGIGYAIPVRFVAEGAKVVLGDLDLDATRVTVDKLGGPKTSVAVHCDVTTAPDVDTLLSTAVETFGSLDVMVTNAGITRDAIMRKMTDEQFDTRSSKSTSRAPGTGLAGRPPSCASRRAAR
jgi:NAD(P)-dependent dehydrogenase (short-subunit alcohol dehydrogenase family)